MPKLKNDYSYTSTPLWAFMACSRENFTFVLLPLDNLKYYGIHGEKERETDWTVFVSFRAATSS
jgi:hypothetical protein